MGLWAKQGQVIPDLLSQLLEDPFVQQAPPKSIGREYYCLSWLEGFLIKDYKAVDVQATLLAFTAQCIANSILSQQDNTISELYLCGGGSHNIHLASTLSTLLPNVKVQSSTAIGINPDFLEAMMFAWLAAQTINHKPIDLSSITGSKSPQILGAVYSSILGV
jgi:anhydro-N-acetylmuramic acid kinase